MSKIENHDKNRMVNTNQSDHTVYKEFQLKIQKKRTGRRLLLEYNIILSVFLHSLAFPFLHIFINNRENAHHVCQVHLTT